MELCPLQEVVPSTYPLAAILEPLWAGLLTEESSATCPVEASIPSSLATARPLASPFDALVVASSWAVTHQAASSLAAAQQEAHN